MSGEQHDPFMMARDGRKKNDVLQPIYILPTRFSSEQVIRLEDEVMNLGLQLTYDAQEARTFLGKLERKVRASFELRVRKVWTTECSVDTGQPSRKRRRVSASGSSPTLGDLTDQSESPEQSLPKTPSRIGAREKSSLVTDSSLVGPASSNRVMVVKAAWIEECVRQSRLVSIKDFLVYDAYSIPKPDEEDTPFSSPSSLRSPREPPTQLQDQSPSQSKMAKGDILARARADAETKEEKGHPVPFQHRRRFGGQSNSSVRETPPKLKRRTTSEFEDEGSTALPDPPDWVKTHSQYSCLRSTPHNPPNAHFISELQKIKLSRVLTLDQIGVRAYSTSIASIAAYPYPLTSPLEILRLPGCEERIAAHFAEYLVTTTDSETEPYLPAARKLDEDEHLQHLKILYNIWGCGADTARRMYFTNGWGDLDDVVSQGWDSLTRAQQIGVKYYDEFLLPIPRDEVESIASIIQQHARRARSIGPHHYNTDGDIVCVIVGGYRRGKEASGDVDVILSHRDESFTHNLVTDVVTELVDAGFVTHTLTLNTTTSKRDQQTLPFSAGHGGHGFDSLDKALCVWQDPEFEQISGETKGKNPNTHRRVDIIISPWRTIGCAVLGWSGATTFQRDIRRWCKREKGWKFDSSGVRDRGTGLVVDLEGGSGSVDEAGGGDTWEERERMVMEGLGIGWRPATERCTM